MSKKEYYFREGCYITELHNTPDDPDVSIARARVEPGATTEWHSLDGTTERYIILEGSGWAEKGIEDRRLLKPGDIFLIEPNQRQRISNPGKIDLIFLAICTPRFIEENYYTSS